MKRTGLLALMMSLAVAAGAGAQTSGKQDPRAPEVKKPESQLKDPESWKTQKEKDQEKAKAKDANEKDGKDAKDKDKQKDKEDKPAKASASSASSSARTGAKKRGASAWTDRAYISGNFGYQLSSKSFSDSRTLTDAGQVDPEKRKFTAKYETESGPTFDVGGAVRLWRNLGAGVAVTRYSSSNDVTIDATVPHPFFFGRDRALSGVVDGKREETAVHVDAVWVIPASRKLQVAVFGGPSFFKVKQTVVSNFTFAQSYPYDEATFTGASKDEESGSVTGFNAGADVAYYFTDIFGVGGIVRFSRGSFDSGVGKIDLGGPEVGFGVRIRLPQGK